MKPKSFDPEKTLAKIAEVFAKSGFEGTSLDDLVKKTGLGKQSLYNTFGDKKEMMKKALGCYGLKSDAAEKLCCPKRTGREKIEAFFAAVIEESGTRLNIGCLISNILLEKGATDSELTNAASSRWNQTRCVLESAIEAGKKDKSIKTSADTETLSFALMNLLSGLRVTARATNDKEKMKQAVQLSVDSLL